MSKNFYKHLNNKNATTSSFVTFDEGSIKATINNLKNALFDENFCEYQFKFDEFTNKILIKNKNDKKFREIEDIDETNLRILLEAKGFKTINDKTLNKLIIYIAKQNSFDSLKDFWLKKIKKIKNKIDPERFFIDYCGSLDTQQNREAGKYLFRSLAARGTIPGYKVDIVIVLKGAQGCGKSAVLRLLALNDDWFSELDLSLNDNELVTLMVGTIINELAELRGHGKRSNAANKSFITRQIDKIRKLYSNFITKFPRRSILVATTNEDEILKDVTGNRRYAIIEVGVTKNINLQQIKKDVLRLMAGGLEDFKREKLNYKKLENEAKKTNFRYEISTFFDEKIELFLQKSAFFFDPITQEKKIQKTPPNTWDYLVLSDVLSRACNIERPTQKDYKESANSLRKLGYEKIIKKINGKTFKIWTKKTP